jgi:7-keto-8-aminopelargonate synthetase-like enzyme
VYAYITHGVLSGGAVARITASKLKELVITDSIQPTEAVRVARNIRVLSDRPADRRSHRPHHAPVRGARQSRAALRRNRHNIGFLAVDEIHRRHRFAPWRRRFQGEIAEGELGGERVLLWDSNAASSACRMSASRRSSTR